jgi:hypothetical protein
MLDLPRLSEMGKRLAARVASESRIGWRAYLLELAGLDTLDLC